MVWGLCDLCLVFEQLFRYSLMTTYSNYWGSIRPGVRMLHSSSPYSLRLLLHTMYVDMMSRHDIDRFPHLPH
jgi:hypothetical protein